MSDDLPLEIQVDIMKKLPVKSLIQFRSVSKAWKSLIDHSDFISVYSGQQQHLLIRYYDDSLQPKYVSIVDDETFPQQKVSLTLPPLVKLLKLSTIIGSSHGLFCLYGYDREARSGTFPRKSMAVIWNISIRKAVAVFVPNMGNGIYRSILGFGVCRETTDPKIVKITHIDRWRDMETIPDNIPWQVEVFTLSTGTWRTPYSTNLPRKSIRFAMRSVVVDGFLYWLATHRDGELNYYNLVVSFDMTSEEFREVNLPHGLAYHRSDENLYISKLRKSLVVLERDEKEMVFVVWMMEDGVSTSYTKILNIHIPDVTVCSVLGFRKTGEPVIEVDYGQRDCSSLVVYNPYSKHINNLQINGTGSFHVYAYRETLLLLDQPDFIIYNRGKTLDSKAKS